MTRRHARWIWASLAALTVLFMALFVVENRRGQDAWAQCRQELEAKGEKLKWEAFIPAPVADEENFYRAPGMMAWFSRQSWRTNKVTIFELPPWATKWPYTLDDLRALPEQEDSVQDSRSASAGSRRGLREWFSQLEPQYDLLVAASVRPAARFDADYRYPVTMDIPNFVNLREVAQALASHASLSVLDGKPEDAVQDLLILRRLADLSGSSPTLVGAMIRVALMGLYVQTARGAIAAGAFSAAQLEAIQGQIHDVNLLADLARALRAERAVQVRLLSLPPDSLTKLLQSQLSVLQAKPSAAFWQTDWKAWFNGLRLRLHLRSRGWREQNLTSLCQLQQLALDQMDVPHLRIHATALSQVFRNMQQTFSNAPSSAQLAAMILPNYSKAALTVARDQTELQQLLLACALERYRLAHGRYPERLAALVPADLDRVPNDLFADQPLQYRLDKTNDYQIWSVGWNERDDGGTEAFDNNGLPIYDEKQGDWLWLGPLHK